MKNPFESGAAQEAKPATGEVVPIRPESAEPKLAELRQRLVNTKTKEDCYALIEEATRLYEAVRSLRKSYAEPANSIDTARTSVHNFMIKEAWPKYESLP